MAVEKHIEDLKLALDAIKVNHTYHQDYDDYDQYDGSELHDMNSSVIELLDAYIKHLESK